MWCSFCTCTFVKSLGLEDEGLQVRGLLESASWSCVGVQVKDGAHVLMWMAYKRMHNQYETRCGFCLIHRNADALTAAFSALGTNYPYHVHNYLKLLYISKLIEMHVHIIHIYIYIPTFKNQIHMISASFP